MIVTKTIEIEVIDHKATGKNAQILRTSKGYKLKDVASLLGVSISFVSDMEHGRHHWNEKWIRKFQEVLID